MKEEERDGKLTFLVVLVIRRGNCWLGYMVYRKPTNTNGYLHARSQHKYKFIVIKTLIHWSVTLSDKDHKKEVVCLKSSPVINSKKFKLCKQSLENHNCRQLNEKIIGLMRRKMHTYNVSKARWTKYQGYYINTALKRSSSRWNYKGLIKECQWPKENGDRKKTD